MRNEIERLVTVERELRDHFLAEAVVIDREKGYISVPSVNQRVNTKMQGLAADLVVAHYRRLGLGFDVVLDVPNSGTTLAAVVAERLKIPHSRGRKGKDIPASWRLPIVVEVQFFTTGVNSTIVFNGLEEGERALVVDDVFATGATSTAIAERLKARENPFEMAAYFAKEWQGGVVKLRKFGIDPFYAIGVQSIIQDNGVWKPELAPPQFS